MQNAHSSPSHSRSSSYHSSGESAEQSCDSSAPEVKRKRDDNSQLFFRLTNDDAAPVECFNLDGDPRLQRDLKKCKKLSPQEVGNLLLAFSHENQRLRAINAAHELRALFGTTDALSRFTLLLPCFPLGQASSFEPSLSMLHNFGIFKQNGEQSYNSAGRTGYPLVNHRVQLDLSVGLFAFHPSYSAKLQSWFDDCNGAGDVLRTAASLSKRPARHLAGPLCVENDARAPGVSSAQLESYLHYLRALEQEPELIKALRPVKAAHFMESVGAAEPGEASAAGSAVDGSAAPEGDSRAPDAPEALDAPEAPAASTDADSVNSESAQDDLLENPGLKLQLFMRCANGGELVSETSDGRPLFSWTRLGHIQSSAPLANNEVYIPAESWQVKMVFRVERPLCTRNQAYELVIRPAAVKYRKEAMYLRVGPFELRNGISNNRDE